MELLLATLFAVLTIAFSLDAVCREKLDIGPCRALRLRYGYSTEKKKCIMFVYGGCDGNANNFRSKKECKKKCGTKKRGQKEMWN